MGPPPPIDPPAPSVPSILFITDHRPGRSPNQRFRFEQYLPWLRRHGWACEVSPIVTEADDRFLYEPGHFIRKLCFVRRSIATRRRDLARAGDFDVIFVCREALMTRSTLFERRFSNGPARLVYDFDDAIWLHSVSDANRRWGWVKDAGKTARIIALADRVIAGNRYLADYALRVNANTTIVPTTIDTDEYRPVERAPGGAVCIGWSGSLTTIRHFQYALPALRAIREKFGPRVSFRVIGDAGFRDDHLGIQGLPWRKDGELDDLRAMDIGIMPLPDDDWARGKCGLKALQYMALGIPPVISPVGVNGEIVQDGINGFLATATDEWVAKLSRLIEDADLRRRMGAEARRTVEEKYSVRAWRDRYLQLFNELITTNGNHHRPETHAAQRGA